MPPVLAAALALTVSLGAGDAPRLEERCARGFAPDCRQLGRARLAGDGAVRDDRLAAASFTAACEAGDPAACGDLAVLYAIGRGLAQSDERAVALSRRACDEGMALACSNLGALLAEGAGAPPPASAKDAGAPVLRLFRTACDAGIQEGCTNLAAGLEGGRLAAPDARGAARALRTGCDAGLALACRRLAAGDREGAPFILGIPGAGPFSPGELAPRAAPGRKRRTAADVRGAPPTAPVDPAVSLLVGLRRGQLGQCSEVPRADRRRAEVRATFLVDADGRAAEVRAASAPADAALAECVRAAVEAWEFPASDEGFSGPFLVDTGFEAAPLVHPSYAGPGFLRPALRDAGCVERALQVPPELQGAAGAVTVKLAVDADGKPGLVHAVSPAPEPLVAAVAAAVGACAWSAGGDADGRPLPLWTTLTVRIAGR